MSARGSHGSCVKAIEPSTGECSGDGREHATINYFGMSSAKCTSLACHGTSSASHCSKGEKEEEPQKQEVEPVTITCISSLVVVEEKPWAFHLKFKAVCQCCSHS